VGSSELSWESCYRSDNLEVRLERYRNDIYAYVSKFDGNNEVSLFNLVEFLSGVRKPTFQSFSDSNNFEEHYRLQFENISMLLQKYLTQINNFFDEANYSKNLNDLRNYMISTYPNLFMKK
jgi:hypothetical protein